MSKYGNLSNKDGNSKFFLQKTLAEHDRSMEHPWMQMIYNQSFSVRQYCCWLARMHASFKALEQYVADDESGVLKSVHDPHLLRTGPLETDLSQLLGASGLSEASDMVAASPATQQYLAHLARDASNPLLILAHHFLQYNAVLSGGAYLGKMVSEKLCVPYGARGVQFYAFEGVAQGKEPARVQQYLKSFNEIEISDEDKEKMLSAMRDVYEDTEAMMQECFDINPQAGISYGAAKDANGQPLPPPTIPDEELLTLTLSELHEFTGADDGRILLSLAGELLDVSAGREMYGPGGGYSLLAGRDVTQCLATMSLEPSALDDLTWEPDNADDEQVLENWKEKLKAKYPVAGKLDKSKSNSSDNDGASPEGLRQRPVANANPTSAPAAGSAPASAEGDQKCPISGKVGVGCPMSMFGVVPKAKPKPKPKEPTAAKTGFMAGKSLVAHVNEATSGGESFIYKLCPLHWDDNTTRLLISVAAAAWISGIFVGWNLHRQLMT